MKKKLLFLCFFMVFLGVGYAQEVTMKIFFMPTKGVIRSNATGELKVDICNSNSYDKNVPAYKIRPKISLPAGLGVFTGKIRNLPAGWSVCSNTGQTIMLNNGSDNSLGFFDCRTFYLEVVGARVGGSEDIQGRIELANEIAATVCTDLGPSLVNDNPFNNESTTAMIVWETYPDFNETWVNVSVSGNVHTNDSLPPAGGYKYNSSAPIPVPGYSNPNTSLPVVNANGTYTFISSLPGVYKFLVPVCDAAGTICGNEMLTITVLDKNNPNPPVANPDWATTKMNTPVTLNTLANDKPGTPGSLLVPSTVKLLDKNGAATTTSVKGGTVAIDPATGNTTYTPPAGFIGKDTLYYKVCDNQATPMCANSIQIISVEPTTAPNSTTAVDDYTNTPMNKPVSGNVKTNDTDPEGNTQTVDVTTQPTITVPGMGTLVWDPTPANNGKYTFTPDPTYVGPVDFVYTTCDNGAPTACDAATLHILVEPVTVTLSTDPDFNETWVNVSVSGNVHTNDNVPAGTVYNNSAPKPVPGYSNPNTSLPVVNANGTYTFVSSLPGVYKFIVPVCSGTTCVDEILTITVLDKKNPNPPVANPDWATTKMNAPVTLNTLANDKPGTPGSMLVPSTVKLLDKTGAPTTTSVKGGTVVIDPATGNTTYTPPTGYTGKDTIYYKVCDNQIPPMCANSLQVITVEPTTAPNSTTAVDDYTNTPMNKPVSGNVKTNDTDPEGNTQTVDITTQPTIPVPGKGTLVWDPATNGKYTFTPVPGYVGPVDFGYKTCDNGVPTACDSATLHILVEPVVSTNPDFNETFVNIPVPGNVSTNDNTPGYVYNNSLPIPLPNYNNPNTAMPTIASNGSYTFVTDTKGVYKFLVPVCDVTGTTCMNEMLTITVQDRENPNPPVANTDWATTKMNVPVTLNTLANDRPGTPGGSMLDPTSVKLLDKNGNPTTTSVGGGAVAIDPATGKTTYTPPSGFTGKDTIYYEVCDNQPPPMCAAAMQIITVLPPSALNTTVAVDDYTTTIMNKPVGGNVKDNDYDLEGNLQTVDITTQPTVTVPGKGTLTWDPTTNGKYNFTPVNGYVGPVDIPYTTCDNAVTDRACASATLHILVRDGYPDLTPVVDIAQLVFNRGNEADFVVDIYELLGIDALYSTQPIQFKLRKISGFDYTVPGITLSATPVSGINSTSNVWGGRQNENGNWMFSQDAFNITVTAKPGINILALGHATLGFHAKCKLTAPNNTSQPIQAIITDGSGGEVNYTNNNVKQVIRIN